MAVETDIAGAETSFDFGVIALIVVAVGIGGYYLYTYLTSGNVGETDEAGQASSFLGAITGSDSVDPNSGQSNGIVNSIDSWLVPEPTPGGGETTGTSETFTGALWTAVSSPFATLSSIFGGN